MPQDRLEFLLLGLQLSETLLRKEEFIVMGNRIEFGVAKEEVRELVKDGYNPIVFCRFIPTVEYVTEALREALRETVRVMGFVKDGSIVTHPEELVTRAADLGYAALAITDECSLAGIVRAYVAAASKPRKVSKTLNATSAEP